MLDLHCHLLPAIDDGAPDLDAALEMARIAWQDGIRTVACTPHIYPGMYENTAPGIARAIDALRGHLDDAGIALELCIGADVHVDPGVVDGIRSGRIPTLAGSRYLLLEPPHHVAPPRFEDNVFELIVAGYVPVITHPERLRWIEDHYAVFERLVAQGALMQVTAGALTGRFGRRPLYWSQRMLDAGLVHLLATDAHHPRRRPPLLAEAREAAGLRVGAEEATHLVCTRPAAIIADAPPAQMPAFVHASPVNSPQHVRRGWWSRYSLNRMKRVRRNNS
jgi:protein-tyrosine phosphatase